MTTCNISVQTFTGKVLVSLRDKTTVAEVKEQIAFEEEIDESHFDIVIEGDVLSDMKKVMISLGVVSTTELEIIRSKKSLAIEKLGGVPPTCKKLLREVSKNGALVSSLIEAGVSTNCRNKTGSTPLHVAVTQGNLTLTKLLLENGALPDCADANGTPLQQAMGLDECNSLQIIEMLLSHNANPNFKDHSNIPSPMHMAAARSSGVIIKSLLRKGGNIDVTDFMGETPLHKAIRFRRDIEIINLLLEHGASVSSSNNQGDTALHLAVLHSVDSVIQFLMKSGADCAIANLDNVTPATLAQRIGRNIF